MTTTDDTSTPQRMVLPEGTNLDNLPTVVTSDGRTFHLRPDDDNLAAALAKFQAHMPVVPKSHTATIRGKDGQAGYSYTYADLADVTAAAMPLLAANGLAFTCLPRLTPSGGYELAGRLTHARGEFLEGALPLQGRQAQDLGSSITYMRRYLLGCITGMVTDDDDDGRHAQAARERTEQQPAPEQQTPPPLAPHVQAVYDRRMAMGAGPTQERVSALWDWDHHQGRLPARTAWRDLTPDQATLVMALIDRAETEVAPGGTHDPAGQAPPDPTNGP